MDFEAAVERTKEARKKAKMIRDWINFPNTPQFGTPDLFSDVVVHWRWGSGLMGFGYVKDAVSSLVAAQMPDLLRRALQDAENEETAAIEALKAACEELS